MPGRILLGGSMSLGPSAKRLPAIKLTKTAHKIKRRIAFFPPVSVVLLQDYGNFKMSAKQPSHAICAKRLKVTPIPLPINFRWRERRTLEACDMTTRRLPFWFVIAQALLILASAHVAVKLTGAEKKLAPEAELYWALDDALAQRQTAKAKQIVEANYEIARLLRANLLFVQSELKLDLEDAQPVAFHARANFAWRQYVVWTER